MYKGCKFQFNPFSHLAAALRKHEGCDIPPPPPPLPVRLGLSGLELKLQRTVDTLTRAELKQGSKRSFRYKEVYGPNTTNDHLNIIALIPFESFLENEQPE